MSYQHSAAFARLKSQKETIGVNLTSGQYLTILDTMLQRAIEPIVLTTNAFDAFVARLMGWQETHTKRKVSLLDKAEFSIIAVSWLLLPTREAKAANVHRLKLDRASLFEFINNFQESLTPYAEACSANLYHNGKPASLSECLSYKHQVESALGSDSSLIAAISGSKYWSKEASAFKSKILEKYIRLCLTAAKADYLNIFDTRVPLCDLVQQYILAASRAIDKCDAKQGVLTTHIRYWFFTARSSMMKSSEHVSDSELSEDTASEELPLSSALESQQANENLRLLASLLDPIGYGRAYLGISEAVKNVTVNESGHYASLVNTQKAMDELLRPSPVNTFND